MCQRQTALRDHLDQVSQAQLEPKIPPHTQNDDFPVKVPARKQLFQVRQLAHLRVSLGSERQHNRPLAHFCTRTLCGSSASYFGGTPARGTSIVFSLILPAVNGMRPKATAGAMPANVGAMRDRADLLIDTNHVLLAEAAARQRSRQIVTQAAASRIKRDEVRLRWCHPLAVVPPEERVQPTVPRDLS